MFDDLGMRTGCLTIKVVKLLLISDDVTGSASLINSWVTSRICCCGTQMDKSSIYVFSGAFCFQHGSLIDSIKENNNALVLEGQQGL